MVLHLAVIGDLEEKGFVGLDPWAIQGFLGA